MADYVIIVAGGKGLRMGAEIPKQFIPVGGKPVLMHTIGRFRSYSESLGVILVLPKAQQEYWRELCDQYHFVSPVMLADGGETRFHSVKNGLSLIPDGSSGVVGVHDGVRPFPDTEVIARCYATARCQGAAIPVVPVIETLRRIPSGQQSSSVTVSRDDYRLVQTPQAFDISLLKEAYRQPYTPMFTDDASVVEHLGHPVCLVEGNRENIKITTPYDLKVAEVLCRH